MLTCCMCASNSYSIMWPYVWIPGRPTCGRSLWCHGCVWVLWGGCEGTWQCRRGQHVAPQHYCHFPESTCRLNSGEMDNLTLEKESYTDINMKSKHQRVLIKDCIQNTRPWSQQDSSILLHDANKQVMPANANTGWSIFNLFPFCPRLLSKYKPLMVGQSGSIGCCRRVIAKAAWILTLGNLSVTRTSMAWWMRSKRSSSIWAFSAMLPSNLLISWHTRKRTAWLLALWDWEERRWKERRRA